MFFFFFVGYTLFVEKLYRETNRKLFLGKRRREKVTGGAEEEEEGERVKKGSSVEIAIAGPCVISLCLSLLLSLPIATEFLPKLRQCHHWLGSGI